MMKFLGQIKYVDLYVFSPFDYKLVLIARLFLPGTILRRVRSHVHCINSCSTPTCKTNSDRRSQRLAKTVTIEYDELMGLPFLDAVCRETLRVFPPVPTLQRV